jgi:predicted  nucleic acid-binding Zn-ribbon protein
VYGLVNALRDASEAVVDKEFLLIRAQEYERLLNEDYNRINQARDQVLKDRLDADIATAAGELEGLVTAFNTATTAKAAFDAELQALKDARAALDTDTSATQTQKDDADALITAKNGEKAAVMEIYNNAKTAKEGKETLIANAAK